MKEFLDEINKDIKDIFQYNIETTKAYVVPSRHDASLTFPNGADKKGKLIETCVLMIDIRNSTKISRQLKSDKVKLGKIYSAFIYSMATIADKYGFVRNIVGDRLMVVFEPSNCFVDAVNCAALMYTVGARILAKYVAIDSFKIGIGIEHGEMLVLKTGIVRKHEEQSEYKGLVWVGDAANTASKLCDFANKDYFAPIFKVTYEYLQLTKKLKGYKMPDTFQFGLGAFDKKLEPEYEYDFTKSSSTATLDYIEFAKDVIPDQDGGKYKGNKVTDFKIEQRTGSTAPILMSDKVFNGYKKVEEKSPFLANLLKKSYPNQPVANGGIYGGTLILKEISQIKIT